MHQLFCALNRWRWSRKMINVPQNTFLPSPPLKTACATLDKRSATDWLKDRTCSCFDSCQARIRSFALEKVAVSVSGRVQLLNCVVVHGAVREEILKELQEWGGRAFKVSEEDMCERPLLAIFIFLYCPQHSFYAQHLYRYCQFLKAIPEK